MEKHAMKLFSIFPPLHIILTCHNAERVLSQEVNYNINRQSLIVMGEV